MQRQKFELFLYEESGQDSHELSLIHVEQFALHTLNIK
jgi:hypothetical protein